MSKPYGDEDALVQYYEPKAVVLFISNPDAPASDPGPIPFRIRIPSAQCRVKVSVNFEPAAGFSLATIASAIEGTGGIWLGAADEPTGGAASTDIPNANVEGTTETPFSFPEEGLIGYTREFVTSADWVLGQLTLPSNTSGGEGALPGAWVLKTSYQADGCVLPCAAWRRIRSMAKAEKA